MKVDGRKGPLDRGVVPASPDLARLRAAIGPVDAVRAERVAALRTAVATGAYWADPVRVAEAMLREVMSDLLAPRMLR